MLPLNLCGKYPLNSMEIGDGSSQSWRWHLRNISTPSFVPSSDWVVATLMINLRILATFYYGSFCRKMEISLLHQSRSPLALISQHEWFLSGAEGRRIKPIKDHLLNLTGAFWEKMACRSNSVHNICLLGNFLSPCASQQEQRGESL